MSRSLTVEKTTGSATSVRGVATSVSRRTTTVCGCGADSQKVTLPAGRCRRPQLDADQFEELDVVAVRHPVQPVDQLVDHLRERLDQGHPRVGHVVVGPLRAALLDKPFRVVDQVLEMTVVQVGRGQHHDHTLRSAMASSLAVRAGGADCAIALADPGSSGIT